MVGEHTGAGFDWRRFAVALAVMAGVGLAARQAAAAAPLFAQGAAGLVAPGGLDQMAKPAAGAAGAAGGAADGAAGEGAAKPADPNAVLIKYAPSYALLVLVLGLGMFIVCRPSPRPAVEKKSDKKSDKKK